LNPQCDVVLASRQLLKRLQRNGLGRAVSRFLSARIAPGRESFVLAANTRNPSRLREDWSGPLRRFPIWPCTRWGFPCRVACASRGALLPHLFTLTPAALPQPGRFVFCGTVRRDTSRHPRPCVSPTESELHGIAPYGVRTFLPRLAPEAILRPSKTTKTVCEARISSRREFPTAQITRPRLEVICSQVPEVEGVP